MVDLRPPKRSLRATPKLAAPRNGSQEERPYKIGRLGRILLGAGGTGLYITCVSSAYGPASVGDMTATIVMLLSGWVFAVGAFTLSELFGGLKVRHRFAVAFIFACVAAVVTSTWGVFIFKPSETAKAPILPDSTIAFGFPESPILLLKNDSDAIARNIKWTVVLWNLDDPKSYSKPADTDIHEPLQIPVGTFDFLRPHTSGGPLNLFDGPMVAPHIRKGDRLFGSASVSCPDCKRGHTYVVSIIYGQSGWYAELPEVISGDILAPSRALKSNIPAYVNQLTARVHVKNKIEIVDLF